MNKRFLRKHQRRIERTVDRILALLYIALVVAGISLVLHVENIFRLF